MGHGLLDDPDSLGLFDDPDSLGLVGEEVEGGGAGDVAHRRSGLGLVGGALGRRGLVVEPGLAADGTGGLGTDDPHALGDRLDGNLGLRLVFVSIVHVASPPAEDPRVGNP